MPKGVYKRSIKEINRIRKLRKGKTPWNLGRHWSDEVKAKLRKARLANPTRYWLGKKRPLATRKKISNLYLFSTNQEHLKYEAKLRQKALELLNDKITLDEFKNSLRLK